MRKDGGWRIRDRGGMFSEVLHLRELVISPHREAIQIHVKSPYRLSQIHFDYAGKQNPGFKAAFSMKSMITGDPASYPNYLCVK